MCLVVVLGSIFTLFHDFRLLGLISARFGGGAMMALILFTGWLGLRVMRENQRPEQMMRWASGAMSGGQPQPEDALIPLVAVFGGLLMLIPGPITDLIGFSLLSPTFARPLARRVMSSRGAGGAGPFAGMGGAGPFGGMGGAGPFGGMGGAGPFDGMGGAGPLGGEAPHDDEEHEAQEQGAQGRRRKARGPEQRRAPGQTIIDVSGEVVSTRESDEA